MGQIYFVRHGQAGSRTDYDSLSILGRRQAELLGRWLAGQNLRFDAAWTGALNRQRATADAVRSSYLSCLPDGGAFPEPQTDPGWDEFDLDAVYNSLAPVLRERDQEFRREHDAMLTEIELAKDDHGASIHRRWTACDIKVVIAWTSGQYPCAAESWDHFRTRVIACRDRIDRAGRGNSLIFTSATPIALWCALTMDIHDGRAMRLAGALLNSSLTVVETRAADVRLHTFNSVPHLADPALRTHR